MSRDTCRYWPCTNPPDPELDGFSGRFCSIGHELKYDHIRADAEDAERADAEQMEECEL